MNVPEDDESEKKADLADIHRRDTEIGETLAPEGVSSQYKREEEEVLIREGAAHHTSIAKGVRDFRLCRSSHGLLLSIPPRKLRTRWRPSVSDGRLDLPGASADRNNISNASRYKVRPTVVQGWTPSAGMR